MKLKLLTNPDATLSKRKNGHLELVHIVPKENKDQVVLEYIFKIYSPDSGIKSVQRIGTWQDFLKNIDIVGFQSGNRRLILDLNEDSCILAITDIAPIVNRDNIGKYQKFYLVLPKDSEKAILIASENFYYNKPKPRVKSFQGMFLT